MDEEPLPGGAVTAVTRAGNTVQGREASQPGRGDRCYATGRDGSAGTRASSAAVQLSQ